MQILGLNGSPRKKGNTHTLLTAFLAAAERLGARTRMVRVVDRNIVPCKELIVCEKKGYCPIDDDMKHEIYGLLRDSDIILLASPVFFYNVTAQLKALIDRCQTLWARKYRLQLIDPARRYRKGFLLATGATQGRNLFEGMKLTAQYFFDAVGAELSGSLTYRGIEGPQDLANHPTVLDDVESAVGQLVKPLASRKKILFACRENAGRSQMAGAFAQHLAGDRFDVATGGSQPADGVNPIVIEAMQERGIDLAFRKPKSIEAALESGTPEFIITMGCGEQCPAIPGAQRLDWELPDPHDQDLQFVRGLRDDIEKRVSEFVDMTG